jgi:hypothetical protein
MFFGAAAYTQYMGLLQQDRQFKTGEFVLSFIPVAHIFLGFM